MKQFMQNHETNRDIEWVRILAEGLEKSIKGGRVELWKTRPPFWSIVMNRIPEELKNRIIDLAKEYESELQKEFEEL